MFIKLINIIFAELTEYQFADTTVLPQSTLL